jgi:hypothetical protein
VVFCSRGGDHAVFEPGAFTPDITTAAGLTAAGQCNPTATTPLITGATFASAEDANGEPGIAPAALHDLRPDFACSELITTKTSARISTLQNGIPYLVGVAGVDKAGNASPIELAVLQRPIPTRDFYRGYRMAGGEAEGGFCALRGRGQRAGVRASDLLVIGLPLAVLGARMARRRARRRDREGRR